MDTTVSSQGVYLTRFLALYMVMRSAIHSARYMNSNRQKISAM